MSERHSEEQAEEGGATRPELEPGPPATAEPLRPQRRSRDAAPWLAALLILVLAGLALSPFWAPALAPLLPWGSSPDGSAEKYAALVARVAAIEQRSARAGVDLEPIKSALHELARRLDQLEMAASADRQLEGAVAAAKAGLQQLQQRLAAVEAQSASRTAAEAADLQSTQQEASRLSKIAADLGNRVAALEREAQSQSGAELRKNAMLALLLGQMREGVAQGRPFPTEYDAFKMLARDPSLATAAEPLAVAARNGVADRAILTKGLVELAGRVASPIEPAAQADWGAQALARLRGLVTIRRIEGPSQAGPEAAVSAAQSAFASGDLAGAVRALDVLTGANAEAARPWLRMAQERLSVEAALDQVQKLLTVRLGSPPAAPAPSPPKAPDRPPEKARSSS